ncbi:MAG: hypothetical protein ABFD14_12095 [Anaerolineaceae bacterium]
MAEESGMGSLEEEIMTTSLGFSCNGITGLLLRIKQFNDPEKPFY